MILEYVASGCSFFRIMAKHVHENVKYTEKTNEILSEINNKNNHLFSLLYNSHTERHYGKTIRRSYYDSIDSIYADSGGLQVVTQGLDITEEFKHKVYENQAESADYGMSFDEIPVSIVGGNRSSRNQTSNRYFDADKFEECAIQTGKNLQAQIEKYLDMKSECKPVFIAQGNCLETYQKWTEIAIQQVDPDKRQHVGSIAMGAAALGQGPMEDIKRAFYYTQLPIETQDKHMHILGVGSSKRLVPYLIFAASGIYDEDTRLSYDSTTHTSAPHFGRYIGKGNTNITLTRNVNTPEYEKVYNDIKRVMGDHLDQSLEQFKVSMNTGMMSHDDPGQVAFAYMNYIASCIINFTEHVHESMQSREGLMDLVSNKERPIFNALYEIRDLKDYQKWEQFAERYIPSSAYQSERPITLEEFF